MASKLFRSIRIESNTDGTYQVTVDRPPKKTDGGVDKCCPGEWRPPDTFGCKNGKELTDMIRKIIAGNENMTSGQLEGVT